MPFLNSVRSTYGSQGRFGGKKPFVNNFVNLTFSTYTQSSDSFSISGNGTSSVSILKTGNSTGPWDSGAWTPTAYTPPFTIEFLKEAAPTDDQAGYAMIGIIPNNKLSGFINSTESYTGSYQFYPFATSSGSVYESLDTQSFGNITSYDTGYQTWVSGSTKFYISVSSNGTLEYFTSNRTSAVRTTTFTPGRTFHPMCAYYSSDSNKGGFKNYRLNLGARYNPATGLYEAGT